MEYKEKVIALLNSQELSKEQKEMLETIFPELAESEDERIRKSLIDMLKNDEKCYLKEIAWLERQGEHKPLGFNIGDEITVNGQICKVVAVEQKPADKVESKFKEGDWVVCEAAPKFTAFKTGDVVQISNKETLKLFLMFEDCFRLWDITKDAKNGDVLATSAGAFIYNGNNGGGSCLGSYCGIDTSGRFKIGVKHHWTGKKVYPATKEQRDQLEKAMADAGYRWNADEKKLEKIEQNPAWSEEDEKQARQIERIVRDDGCTQKLQKQIADWFKSLKERCNWKPSDEQMNALNYVVNLMASSESPVDNDYYYNVFKDLREQLKKLKDEK